MDLAITALKTQDSKGISDAVRRGILTRPLFYKEFLELDPKDEHITVETLALYALPLLETDVIIGQDMDPYSEGIVDRISPVSMSVRGARWYYDLSKTTYDRVRLKEPYVGTFASIETKYPTDHTWLISLVKDDCQPERTELQMILRDIWDHQGKVDMKTLSLFPSIPALLIYFLFYFTDILPQAEKNLMKIFNNDSKVQDLELAFYRDLLKKYPNIESKKLNPFFVAYYNPDRTDIDVSKTDWDDEDISRLVLKNKRWSKYWSVKTTFSEDIESMLNKLWNSNDSNKVVLARSILKALPSSYFKKWMAEKKHPIWVITGIYERGFTLDDSCLYLFDNHQGYELTMVQCEDFVMRFRGSKEVLYKIIQYELKSFGDMTSVWHLGLYYKDAKLLKAGSGIIASEGYTQYSVDDILLIRPKEELETLTNKFFPATESMYYKLLMKELKRLY